jgi:Loader and inhibitor of phage G40P
MNKKDVLAIIKAITTFYPNFKMDDPQATLNAWHIVLQDYEVESIMANLAEYVKANRFAPTVADLLKVETPKDRAIPSIDETKAMLEKWEKDRENKADEETVQKALAEMRKILGINRG